VNYLQWEDVENFSVYIRDVQMQICWHPQILHPHPQESVDRRPRPQYSARVCKWGEEHRC